MQQRSIAASLEIEIEDFSESTGEVLESTSVKDPYSGSTVTFSVSVFPNGVDEKTVDRLVILPNVKFKEQMIVFHNTCLSWTVSIIDVNGESIIPVSFQKDFDREIYLGAPSDRDFSQAQYLERSFILNRENALKEGCLTLRCEISLSGYDILHKFPPMQGVNIIRSILERLEYLGFHSIQPQSLEGIEIAEKNWIIVTSTGRFFMSFNKQHSSVGVRLFESSPVIQRCVEVIKEEKRKKRIEFPNLDRETFTHILFFLMHEELFEVGFNQLFNLYKFSHLLEMKKLQKECAREFLKKQHELRRVQHENMLKKELKALAHIYFDDYLKLIFEMDDSDLTDEFKEVSNDFDLFKNGIKIELNGNSLDSKEDEWDFVTSPDILRLSLKSDLVIKILDASPIVRDLVEEKKEQKINRLELPEVDSETFKIVLYSLKVKELFGFKFQELYNVYKFSHQYEMIDLQRKCADALFEEIYPKNFSINVNEILDILSDQDRPQPLDNKYKYKNQIIARKTNKGEVEDEILSIRLLEALAYSYSDVYFSQLLYGLSEHEKQILPSEDSLGLKPFPNQHRAEASNSRDCNSNSWLELDEDITEHTWIFDSPTDRFYLSLDETKDTLGTRFLKASPVISDLFKFKLSGENYVSLREGTTSETFKRVLYFLKTQKVDFLNQCRFHELLDVYMFSSFYQMEELQERCVDVMIKDVKPKSYLKEALEGIANRYHDKYLEGRLSMLPIQNSESKVSLPEERRILTI